MTDSPFREIWVEGKEGQAMCALTNGELGWLMYLRTSGDAGFSSRNPAYQGQPDAMIQYQLDNGQMDEYPAAWAYSLPLVEEALRFFREFSKPPPFVHWHNDSGDGSSIGGEIA